MALFLWQVPVFNILQQSVLLRQSTWTKMGLGPNAFGILLFSWLSSRWKAVCSLFFFVYACMWLMLSKLLSGDWDRKTELWKRIPCYLHWLTGEQLCCFTLFRPLVREVRLSRGVQSCDGLVESRCCRHPSCRGLGHTFLLPRPIMNITALLARRNLLDRFTVSAHLKWVKSILLFLLKVTLK